MQQVFHELKLLPCERSCPMADAPLADARSELVCSVFALSPGLVDDQNWRALWALARVGRAWQAAFCGALRHLPDDRLCHEPPPAHRPCYKLKGSSAGEEGQKPDACAHDKLHAAAQRHKAS